MNAAIGWILGIGDADPDWGDLQWLTPRWAIALIGVALAAAAVLAVRRSGRGRLAEMICWGLALLGLGVALADPALITEATRREPGRLLVLVDGSASLAVLEDGRPRADAVPEILDAITSGGGEVEVFTFDEELRAGAPVSWTGRGTDLGVALNAVVDRTLGQRLAGVAVITDGIDRGALRTDAGALPELPGPLTLYQVGEASALYDVSIEDVVSSGFAFLRSPFNLEAKVRGPAGETIPVTLSREGREVKTQEVTLDEDGRGSVRFSVMPRKVGRFAWEIAVPISPEDAVPGNNTFPVVIRVVRDRTRVLQVCGSPSYDEKFLRLFLKEDPSVDLVSFFILRTHADFNVEWRSHEISLIEFPYERLFQEDLLDFDLVILQNFDYAPYFRHRADELLDNLATFVTDGGALVMIGGDRSFDIAEYDVTSLAGVLPVKLGIHTTQTDFAAFRPELTAAGGAHPITGGAADWSTLPMMDGLNLTGGLTRGSATLLAHPTLKTREGAAMPVLAVREIGRGRTMALTVDASWRWSFSEAAVGRGNQAYLRFWKNALRWLVADPEDRRVVVAPSRENVLLGDPVTLGVAVRDAGYGPVTGAHVEGTIRGPDGAVETFTLVTDAAGEARAEIRPTVQGAHRVEVRSGAGPADRGETVFAVNTRDPELADITPDAAFLAGLAERAGGEYRPAGDLSPPLLDDSAERLVEDRQEIALGSAPWVALWFGLWASAAWWLRRRGGGH